jgi:Tfp pilus assembly protein PilZ
MTKAASDLQFFLTFESAEDFDRSLERRGEDTGFFFPSTRPLKVGTRVTISVSIKGIKKPVFVTGRVVWRRHRSGGKNLPVGLFVALMDRERARLDALVEYLADAPQAKDKRKHFRYPIILPARYRTAKGEYDSETRDLSRGGAFLRCMGPLLTVGSPVSIMLFLDGKEGKGLPVEAQVAWIDYFDETKGMGVQFQRGAAVRKIGRFLDQYEKDLKKRTKKKSS